MESQPPRQDPIGEIVSAYRQLIEQRHPAYAPAWPLVGGYNIRRGTFGRWNILIFEHTGNSVMRASTGIGELTPATIGYATIDASNRETVRKRLEDLFNIKPADAVMIVADGEALDAELLAMLRRHEIAMGLYPMKVFLSHKGADKSLVRRFKSTLSLLGFDPWLDEDAMAAGTELERGILRGFQDSCAAVFFVTPNFVDENYLATEINYAMAEKRTKGDRFAIITLVFSDGERKGAVPALLRQYVWKNPGNELEALQEIIKALPVEVGRTRWKF